MSYYDLLDILPDASEEEVRRAYRALVEIHHPDRLQDLRAEVRARAETRLKRINEAYRVLRDPAERARYDAALALANAEPPPFTPRGNPAIARGKLRARLAEIEATLAAATAELAALRPALAAGGALEARWERYLFASLILLWPFLFLGTWVGLLVASNPLAPLAQGVTVGWLAFDYLALGVITWASGVPGRQGWPGRVALVPIVGAFFVLVVLAGLGRSVQLAALLLGYGALAWKGAGQRLAAERDRVLVTGSKIERLEEEVRNCESEKRHLLSELARH